MVFKNIRKTSSYQALSFYIVFIHFFYFSIASLSRCRIVDDTQALRLTRLHLDVIMFWLVEETVEAANNNDDEALLNDPAGLQRWPEDWRQMIHEQSRRKV